MASLCLIFRAATPVRLHGQVPSLKAWSQKFCNAFVSAIHQVEEAFAPNEWQSHHGRDQTSAGVIFIAAKTAADDPFRNNSTAHQNGTAAHFSRDFCIKFKIWSRC